MGFFDKVKRALNIGGAKVEVTPPGVLHRGSSFTVSARIRGGKLEQKITRMVATLELSSTATQYGLNNQQTRDTQTVTVSQDEAPGFTLQPGETKEFTFKLKLDAGAGAAAGVMAALGTLNKLATGARESWELKVVAEIEGSANTSGRVMVRVE